MLSHSAGQHNQVARLVALTSKCGLALKTKMGAQVAGFLRALLSGGRGHPEANHGYSFKMKRTWTSVETSTASPFNKVGW